MKVVRGDLVALAERGDFDVIVHGCNCRCTMGAGIAKAIRDRFPAAYEADLATPTGDRAKLGTVSTAEVQVGDHTLTVVNGYTQFEWRGPGRKVDYDALRAVFREVARRFPAQRIGYPLIGAGLAGGDWDVIAPIIDDELRGLDHTLVQYAP